MISSRIKMKFNYTGPHIVLTLIFFGAILFSGIYGQGNPSFPIPGQTDVLGQTTGSGDDEIVGQVYFSDSGTNEVLDVLQTFSGKAILRQQNLPAVKINFKYDKPMTRGEAIMVIESLLSLNGIAITEVGENYIKAVPSTAVNTQVPRMIDGTSFIEEASQKVFSKFFKLDFLNVTEAIPLIQPLLSMGAPIIYEKSNAMLVTDALINLQRVENIISQVDKPADLMMATIFFQLKHVAASEIAKRLQAMQAGSLRRFLENNTTFDADDRTNQLLVFTHRSNEEMIRKIIGQLDIDVAPYTKTEIFYIKHADATEITSLIEQIITGQQRSRENSRSGSGGGTRSVTGQQAGGNKTPDPIASVTTTNQTSEVLETVAKNLQFSDHLTIVADARGNAILASGTQTDLTYLKELIDKIDILLAQVRIDVVIAEVSLSGDQVRGIDSFNLKWDYNYALDDPSGTTQVRGDDFVYSMVAKGFDIDASASKVMGTLQNLSITGILDTARTKSNVTVLSSPTIVTTHNKEATISVGEERPVITQSQTSSSETFTGSLRSTVQYKRIGIELKVKPLIGSNDIIQLEIDQKVDNVIDQLEIDGNEQPIIGSRQATSYVSVSNGDMIILGGLQSLDRTHSESRMAFLGSIPVLGVPFRSQKKEQIRRELLIFIRPKIVRTTEEAFMATLEEIEKSPAKEDLNRYLETGKIDLELENSTKKKNGNQ